MSRVPKTAAVVDTKTVSASVSEDVYAATATTQGKSMSSWPPT